MPRRDDIPAAFRNSITQEPSGRRIVRTTDFVRELAAVNYVWTLEQANLWVEHYQSSFSDISTEPGPARVFYLFNPINGGF